MTHLVPQEKEGDPRLVLKEAEVTMTPQLGEMTIVSHTKTESSTAAADVAATTLLHPEEEDPEEMNLGLQGQGLTPLFQGVSQDLELPNILDTDVMTPIIMTELKGYLIEQETLTPPGGSMRDTLCMMLKQHHQRPPLDQDRAAEMRGIIPGPQPRQLPAKQVRLLTKVLQGGNRHQKQL